MHLRCLNDIEAKTLFRGLSSRKRACFRIVSALRERTAEYQQRVGGSYLAVAVSVGSQLLRPGERLEHQAVPEYYQRVVRIDGAVVVDVADGVLADIIDVPQVSPVGNAVLIGILFKVPRKSVGSVGGRGVDIVRPIGLAGEVSVFVAVNVELKVVVILLGLGHPIERELFALLHLQNELDLRFRIACEGIA